MQTSWLGQKYVNVTVKEPNVIGDKLRLNSICQSVILLKKLLF
jgi:hypothetical protein